MRSEDLVPDVRKEAFPVAVRQMPDLLLKPCVYLFEIMQFVSCYLGREQIEEFSLRLRLLHSVAGPPDSFRRQDLLIGILFLFSVGKGIYERGIKLVQRFSCGDGIPGFEEPENAPEERAKTPSSRVQIGCCGHKIIGFAQSTFHGRQLYRSRSPTPVSRIGTDDASAILAISEVQWQACTSTGSASFRNVQVRSISSRPGLRR